MIICVCNNINEAKIRQAVDEGATTCRAVFDHNDTRLQCGKCVADIRHTIRERQHDTNHQPIRPERGL